MNHTSKQCFVVSISIAEFVRNPLGLQRTS